MMKKSTKNIKDYLQAKNIEEKLALLKTLESTKGLTESELEEMAIQWQADSDKYLVSMTAKV